MLGWIFCIILIVPLVFFCLKYNEKKQLDREEENQLKTSVALLKQERNQLQTDIDYLNEKSDIAIERYNNSLKDKSQELDNYFKAQKSRQQQILDEDLEQLENYLNEKKYNVETEIKAIEHTYLNKKDELEKDYQQYEDTICAQIKDYMNKLNDSQQLYESVLAPIRQYEKDQQEKLFYTVQIPEEYQPDINYLLNTVAPQMRHPDIISKLIWSEYIKPYLDEAFKRIGINADAGIYKITNIQDNKSYIGKGVDIKKRITDHFKGAIGIKSIADQAIHHAMLEQGLWNWAIEAITYCDKDQLSELEKYYIEFFKTQEYGYNKKGGG